MKAASTESGRSSSPGTSFSARSRSSPACAVCTRPRVAKTRAGPNGLPMDVGDIFKPKDYARDVEAVEDFYGVAGVYQRNDNVGQSVGRSEVDSHPQYGDRHDGPGVPDQRGPAIHYRAHRDSRQHGHQGQGYPPRVGGGPWGGLRHGASAAQPDAAGEHAVFLEGGRAPGADRNPQHAEPRHRRG